MKRQKREKKKRQRECLPNHTYHTYSRCIEKQDMMKANFLKEMLIKVMDLALEKYKFKLIWYTILDNHFHFIIKTIDNGATISRIMQYIKARFAQDYNRLMDRSGPFWNERFGDSIIEHAENPEEYLKRLLCYLGFNPVRKKMVNSPGQYKYCSYKAYMDENYISPLKITIHEFFLKLGDTFEERVKKFMIYEEAYRKRLSIIFESLS